MTEEIILDSAMCRKTEEISPFGKEILAPSEVEQEILDRVSTISLEEE